MAFTTTAYPRGIQYLGGQFPSTPFTRSLPFAANQTIYAGDLIIFASGLCSKFSSGVTTTGLLGIAAKAVTTGASVTLSGSRGDVQLITPNSLWVASMVGGAATDKTSAQATIGVAYGVIEDNDSYNATGRWYINFANTTNTFAFAIDWAPRAYQEGGADVTVATTKNAAVIFRWISSACLI